MCHLSAGELLRKERTSGSSDGELIESFIRNGNIVPVHITLSLLKKAIESSSASTSRFLVDGFPRNADNLNGWEQTMSSICEVESMIFLDCGESELERRLLSRGMTSGRSDDNLEAARKRFVTFKEITMPVVAHFEALNKLRRVSGEGSIDEVYAAMCRAIYPLFEQEVTQLNALLLQAMDENNKPLVDSLLHPEMTSIGLNSSSSLTGSAATAAAGLSTMLHVRE